jgi:hypothetical protein
MAITTDNALTAGANENIADVAANIEGIARDLAAPMRLIHESQSGHLSPSAVADTYHLSLSHTEVTDAGDIDGKNISTFRWEASDYAITGLTTKMFIRAQCLVNATAPTNTFTVGLYPQTAAGAANALVVEDGTIVANSTVAFAAPSASTIAEGDTGNITIPSDGQFGLYVVLDDTMASNSSVRIAAQVYVRWVE